MVSLLIASRNRVDRLDKCVTTARETADGEIEIVVRYDDDDQTTHNYVRNRPYLVGLRGPRNRRKPAMYNEAFRASKGDVVGCLGDDVVFKSKGWDTKLETSILATPHKMTLAWGCDGAFNESLAIHPFMSRKWYDVLGYILPEHFMSIKCDDWMFHLARVNGLLHYFPSVKMWHDHPEFLAQLGKKMDKPEETDSLYKESAEHFDADNELYAKLISATDGTFDKEAHKIKVYLAGVMPNTPSVPVCQPIMEA